MSMSALEKVQLKIMYLFMNADGLCHQKEIDIFNSLCDELKISNEEKESVIEFANGIGLVEKSDNSALVISTIDSILSQNVPLGMIQYRYYTCTSLKSSKTYAALIDKDKSKQAQIIWSLLNLGYADNILALSEKKVIDYLVALWNVNEEVIATLYDTAQTILSLQQKKEWLLTIENDADDKVKICEDINREINKMYSDVEITISEINI